MYISTVSLPVSPLWTERHVADTRIDLGVGVAYWFKRVRDVKKACFVSYYL